MLSAKVITSKLLKLNNNHGCFISLLFILLLTFFIDCFATKYKVDNLFADSANVKCNTCRKFTIDNKITAMRNYYISIKFKENYVSPTLIYRKVIVEYYIHDFYNKNQIDKAFLKIPCGFRR